jgi:hypothetical protein
MRLLLIATKKLWHTTSASRFLQCSKSQRENGRLGQNWAAPDTQRENGRLGHN